MSCSLAERQQCPTEGAGGQHHHRHLLAATPQGLVLPLPAEDVPADKYATQTRHTLNGACGLFELSGEHLKWFIEREVAGRVGWEGGREGCELLISIPRQLCVQASLSCLVVCSTNAVGYPASGAAAVSQSAPPPHPYRNSGTPALVKDSGSRLMRKLNELHAHM